MEDYDEASNLLYGTLRKLYSNRKKGFIDILDVRYRDLVVLYERTHHIPEEKKVQGFWDAILKFTSEFPNALPLLPSYEVAKNLASHLQLIGRSQQEPEEEEVDYGRLRSFVGGTD